jgi:hypothetical protein
MFQPAFYQASGSSSLRVFPWLFIVGIPCAVVAALLYAYLIVYIPIAGYITFILSAGFGFLLGLCAYAVLRGGKVRSTWKALALGGFLTLIGFYAHWAVWCAAVLARGDVDVSALGLALNPSALMEVITTINGVGAWSMRGTTPTGGWLWALWTIEAALIFVPALLVVMAVPGQPFCERCERWCEDHDNIARLDASDPARARALAEKKNFSQLAALGAAAEGAPTHLRVDLTACPRCTDMTTLSIHTVTRTVDDKGKESEDKSALIEHLLLSAREREEARGIAALSATMLPAMAQSDASLPTL